IDRLSINVDGSHLPEGGLELLRFEHISLVRIGGLLWRDLHHVSINHIAPRRQGPSRSADSCVLSHGSHVVATQADPLPRPILDEVIPARSQVHSLRKVLILTTPSSHLSSLAASPNLANRESHA